MFRVVLFLFFPAFVFAAPFNLHSDSPLSYASESLKPSDFKANDILIIKSAGDTLNLTFQAGFSLSATPKYIRLDLLNGQFGNASSAGAFMPSGSYSTTLAAGGAEGDDFIIAEVVATSVIGNATSFTLPSDRFYILDTSKPLSVRYRLYDSATAAINDGDIIVEITSVLAKVEQGLGNNFAETFTQRVGFGDDFLRFVPNFRSPSTFLLGDATKTLASLARFNADRLLLDEVRLASTSAVITDFRTLLANINTASPTATISGDFSSIKAFMNSDNNCAGTSYDLANYLNERQLKISLDNLIAYPVLCISAENNKIVVKRSAYQLDLGIGAASSKFGEIAYDAATVDLPYITTYSGYRQRILLVNHAGYDVKYNTEFTAEGNAADTFTSGDAALGVIPANSTLKLDALDLVNMNSAKTNRISARLLIDAKPADISVAVQILSFKSSEPPQTNVLDVIKY
jgi:hypothetical protein